MLFHDNFVPLPPNLNVEGQIIQMKHRDLLQTPTLSLGARGCHFMVKFHEIFGQHIISSIV